LNAIDFMLMCGQTRFPSMRSELCSLYALTENAGHEFARHEIAGHEIAGHENAGLEFAIHDIVRKYITLQCSVHYFKF